MITIEHTDAEDTPLQGTEYTLLCGSHAHEYQADIAASVATTTATVEDLS